MGLSAAGIFLLVGSFSLTEIVEWQSMHAWGIAVDLDPINNQLRWGKDRASFARPEFEPFWKIVEANGATSLGRAQNRDWMHYQFAGL